MAFPPVLPAVDVEYSGVYVPRTGTAVGIGLFGINVLLELVVLLEKRLLRRPKSLGQGFNEQAVESRSVSRQHVGDFDL